MTVDAGISATAQTAMSGGSGAQSFLSNFLGSAAVRAALTPLNRAAQAWGTAEQDIANLAVWEKTLQRGKVVARAGAVLTTAMITGAATDYVVHRMYHHGQTPTEQEALDWTIQGGSIAIGMFVGKWASVFERRAIHFAEHKGQMLARARRLKALSAEVVETRDKDAALELLIRRQEALDAEARILADYAKRPDRPVSPAMLETLRVGNAAERGAVKDAAFATVPLRLAGLAPDDASGRIWAGTTEEIAIALHQADRVGLAVEILAHDVAARQWRVRYNHQEITILETSLRGQPRAAKPEPTAADRTHAARYAESAEFMQDRWEAKVKRDVDARAVMEVDHLQVGYAYAGVVNQATLPTGGQGLDQKLIVYTHKGTLSKRGTQELGQPPEKFDAPGVRATEQAPRGTEWIESQHLDRALDIGRIETQTPAYQGAAIELQVRGRAPAVDPWSAPDRQFRVKIRDANGVERWFYCNRFDNAGGLGPASLKAVADVIDPAHHDAMLAGQRPQILRGDDPDYMHRLKAGRILVWGGSPTGAWAAEPGVHKPDSSVTVLGDTLPGRDDWPTLLREYEDVTHEIANGSSDHVPADLAARKRQLEGLLARAHGGMTIPRNRKPGATYEKPLVGRRPGEVQIEFGSPTELTPLPDGRVLVTVGTGESARTSIYAQVVVAHGQDPGAAGAPGALLGAG
ncbi:MAG: hypothetical protein H0X17_07365, partial [Deltaproteobacteria bacterium]|nr:hypothetical protein [Deltaproteobacteria bacterium]